MTVHPVRAELLIDDDWVNVSDRLRRRSSVTVRRGRDDELAQATPSQISMVLGNDDGQFTPRNPLSTYYPHWQRGTRCRVWVDGGVPALVLPGVTGSYASTPDTAALDITGTITVLARVDPESWAGEVTYTGGTVSSGGNRHLVTKSDTPSDISWILYINGPGWLSFVWSTTGAAVSGTRVCPKLFHAQKPMWLGCTFVPNDGAGNNTIAWWSSEDGFTFTQVDSETQAGTTSIFSGAAPVEIGSRSFGEATYPGRVLGAVIINGTFFGSVVANPDFTTQTPGTRSFTDSAGRVWTVHGDAEIATRTIRGVGQVDEIAPDWPFATARDHPLHEGVSHVQVTASGMLRRMGQGAKPLNSTLFRKITSPSAADNVIAYWPLEDGADSGRASSPITGVTRMNVGLVGDSWRFASDSTLPASKPLPHVDGLIAFAGVVPPYSSTQSRVDIFARIDTPNVTPDGSFITAVETNGTASRWTFAIDDTNYGVFAQDVTGTPLVASLLPSDEEMFDTWCLWSFNMEQNGGNVDWDIAIVPIGAGGGAFTNSGSFAGTVGTVTHLHNWLTNAPTDGGISFGHAIVSVDAGLGWLSGADTAWVGESAAHRFWRLCIEENIPVHIIGDNTVAEEFRGDTSLSEAMGPQHQQTLVDLLADCAQVDGGIMSEHRSAPALDYRTRASLYNQDSALTLDTSQQGIGRELAPVDDDQRLRNDVTATRPDGSSTRVTTDPAPDPGDLYDVDITVNVEDDSQLRNQAGWRLHLGTWPAMRYPGLGTSLRTAGAGVARPWADLALGDKLRMDNMPRQHERTTDVLVEGYTETLSHFDWITEINASPAGPWTVGVREDEDLGIRGSHDSTLNSSFAAGTATTMSVTTSEGPLWAVTAATNSGLPFDVEVGGFQITVTAIGAPAGTVQTFTVTATPVNLPGETKTIAAGTSVRLWTPCRRAL